MDTNLYILYDDLRQHDVKLVISREIQALDISSIFFLPENYDQLHSDYLYICTAAEMVSLKSNDFPLNFALVGDIKESLILDSGHSALIFPRKMSFTSVFNLLQEIKHKYDMWDEEMLEAVFSKDSKQKIMDIGAKFLSNPVAFFDQDFGLVMTAGQIPDSMPGSIWEPVLKNSYPPPEALTPKQRATIMKRYFESEWPFIYHSSVLDETHLVCSIVIDGTLYGTFGATEIISFTQGQCSLLYCLSRRLKQALVDTIGEFGTTVELPFFIHRLLRGIDVEENVMNYHLGQVGWKSGDYFRVFRLEPEDKSPLSKEMCDAYRNPIKRILPDTLISQYENGILVILHSRTPQQVSHELINTLDKYKLRAGQSMEFQNFMYIKYAYIQCKNALNSAGKQLVAFEDHYTECLMDKIAQVTSLKSFCHPVLLQMLQQGTDKERLFIESMHVYIENGRNLTDAAKKLGIHRNTLTYRLQVMNDLLGIDLFCDVLSDDILMLLNFSCRILQIL